SKIQASKGDGIEKFLFELSQPTPTPGGGSCSALAGAIASSLLLMVVNLTLNKPASPELVEEFSEIKQKLNKNQKQFNELITLDAQAFDAVINAYKLPKNTDEEKAKRTVAIQNALKNACRIPEEVFDLSKETLHLLLPIAQKGNKNAISDVGVALAYLKTAIDGAKYNILINLKSIADINFIEEKKRKLNLEMIEIEKLIGDINRIIEAQL
ncbi:MAG: cyclodeaminase/cyclohydrolase family protein, partial [candidate division WOR-3 bacterium]|nr:cyclodeaminase/cyclohydrolase family protein [candidate division WOR-3 bacterium]